MLFLALFAAFFVGSAITGMFSDYEAEAKKDNDNGNNGCENANPNAKACEKNPNTCPDGGIPSSGQCPPSPIPQNLFFIFVDIT